MLNNKALAASLSAGPKTYVEDVFSTYLYTGNGTTQTITNGIDLASKGGLVWNKSRSLSGGSGWHFLYDTDRGVDSLLATNSTASAYSITTDRPVSSFNSNGFTTNYNGSWFSNNSGSTYASWTFRKAAKFFDVVTWTAVGTSGNRRISHNLGSVPGCIIVKVTNAADSWYVYHRSEGRSKYLRLNSTDASASQTDAWGTSDPTSTDFGFAENIFSVPGWTYVAYLFAHDAGGFGDSGNDNVISCGSFTTNAYGAATVTLGWEPQWVLFKRSNTSAGGSQDKWQIIDNLRGLGTAGTTQQVLFPNDTNAESAWPVGAVTATGFATTDAGYVAPSSTFIYIAIRRGPMKTPTDATKVFTSITKTAASGQINTSDFPVDLSVDEGRSTNYGAAWFDRLRGRGPYLLSSSTNPEGNQDPTYYIGFDSNTGVFNKNYGGLGGGTYVNWLFRRAPGFFDVVAYSGGGTSKNHNLGVKPELAFIKVRSTSFRNWIAAIQGGTGGYLNTSDPINASNLFVDLSNATSTTFPINGNPEVGQSGQTYIAYLFATCPGVSKVGSYTGTGNSTLNVNCGFTTGARFVLIKRTDSAGDWYVWDSARGLTVSSAPYLLFNSTATEVTGTTYINSISTGFGVSAGSPEIPVNFTGASYIYLAIA
jgi:hypothetical protein